MQSGSLKKHSPISVLKNGNSGKARIIPKKLYVVESICKVLTTLKLILIRDFDLKAAQL